MRTKIIVGFIAVAALLAVAATPVLARWTPVGGGLKGKAGPGVLDISKAKVECTSASGTKGEVLNEGKELKLGVVAWNGCSADLPGIKVTKGVVVTCNNLTLVQNNKEGTTSGTASGKLGEECTIVVSACTIKVPKTKANEERTKIALAKEGANQKDVVEVRGITVNAKGAACESAGLESTTEGKLKVPSLLIEGIGLE